MTYKLLYLTKLWLTKNKIKFDFLRNDNGQLPLSKLFKQYFVSYNCIKMIYCRDNIDFDH